MKEGRLRPIVVEQYKYIKKNIFSNIENRIKIVITNQKLLY